MSPTTAHLNGSVNLANAETVMREVLGRIPRGLRRRPDGETGERAGWIGFQFQKFEQTEGLELRRSDPRPAAGSPGASIRGGARCPRGRPCCGDAGHEHFKQPETLGLQVRMMNAVSERARRPVSWYSITVPQEVRDPAYFAPLAGLMLDSYRDILSRFESRGR